MIKNDLIATARRLTQPSTEAAREYSDKREMLAAQITRMLLLRPDLERLIGSGNQSMMEDNHRNHARFMESMFVAFVPEILVDTVLWVFRAYRSHGFSLAYWPAQLDTWVEVLKRELSEDSFQALYPFYNWMIIHQPTFVLLSEVPEAVSGPIPQHGKA